MILPRQDQNDPSPSSPLPTTTTTFDPPNPSLLQTTYSSKLALESWQIVLIVIGSLLFLGVLGTLVICIRTRLTMRRAASTTRFKNAFGADTSGEFATETPDARRESNTRTANVNGAGGGGGVGVNKRERRDSVIDDAKVQIRRLMKKSRPRARSASYPSTPTSPYKGGVDFGLSALRFGGSGGEKVANGGGGGGGGGNGKGRKGRRKSQNGIDMRIRSADDHADDVYQDNGRALPFGQNENATGSGSGSGFVGSAHSGTRLMSAASITTAPRTEEDAFVTGARPGRGRDSEDWGYGNDSIAHTVRGSFEDAEEQERQRNVAQQHHQLSAAVERLAQESNSWPGHDRGGLR